jgi:C-terminal processing protease CtpA/Prc
MKTFIVVLRKCSRTGDFGMVVRGGSEFNMSLYVLRLLCGGSASYDERLQSGDEILEINGRCTRTMKLNEAVENMKSRNTVSLLIRRTGFKIKKIFKIQIYLLSLLIY